MKIREVNENKKQFISLLLLADEQESMVDHYLEKGTMYVLEDGIVYEPNEQMKREYCGKNHDTKGRYHQLQKNIIRYLKIE